MKYDARDPRYATEGVPYDLLAKIRREEPVCDASRGYFLSRREEIEQCLLDVETFVADLAPLSGFEGREYVDPPELFLSEIEEPRHGQIRRLYNACFARHRVLALGDYAERTCHDLIDRMLERPDEPADLMLGYAMPIPSLVLARMMGLPDPAEAAATFMKCSLDGSMMMRPSSPGIGPEGPPIQQYFARELMRRRAEGEPEERDVYTVLMGAEIDGEPLTDVEILTQLQFMVTAGVHTTRTFLAHLVHRLLIDPELMRTLDADRSLVPNYLEESLRHDSPVQGTGRRAMRDTSLGGVEIAKGEWIEVGLGSGNRDEASWDDADVFRLDRENPRDHVAFGAASHVCPGAALARHEGEATVNVLLDRIESMEKIEGASYPPLPSSLSDQPILVRLVPKGSAGSAHIRES